MATKTIIVESNKGEKWNYDNYEIWPHKIQYILKDQEVFKTLNYVMVEPASEETQQHEINLDNFQV